VPNRPYQLVVSAVRNITAVPLGGGSAELVLQPPDLPTDAVFAEDSLALPDTGAVRDTSMAADTTAGRGPSR